MKKLFTYALALPLMAAMMMVGCSREPMGDIASGGPDGRQWVEKDEMFVIKDNRLTADNIVGYSKMLAKGLGVGTRGVVREVGGVVPILRDEIAAVSAVVGGDSIVGGGANGLAARGVVPFSVSESDTVMYAVNFKNDQGYMLLSSDSRVPMLAVIDEGGYNGVGDNPGFHMFLEMSEPYIAYSIAEFERTKDSIAALPSEDVTGNGPSSRIVGDTGGGGWGDSGNNGGYPPPILPDKYLYDAEFVVPYSTALTAPLIYTVWSQGTPYNDLVKICSKKDCKNEGKRYAAGCVTIALAQLFAYHKHPSFGLGGEDVWFNWSEIHNRKDTPNKNLQIAILVNDIVCQLHPDYDCNKAQEHSTGSNDERWLREVLPKYGYAKPGSWGNDCAPYSLNNYISDDVGRSISRGLPVYIGGYSNYSHTEGHAWLLDGYLIKSFKKETWEYWHSYKEGREYRVLKSRVECGPKNIYMHCNWGWGKGHNGYYNEGVWDAKGDHYNDYMDPVYGTEPGEHNYKYKIGVYTNLRPIK